MHHPNTEKTTESTSMVSMSISSTVFFAVDFDTKWNGRSQHEFAYLCSPCSTKIRNTVTHFHDFSHFFCHSHFTFFFLIDAPSHSVSQSQCRFWVQSYPNAFTCRQFNVLSWPSVAFVLWLSATKYLVLSVNLFLLFVTRTIHWLFHIVCVSLCTNLIDRAMLSTMIINFLCTMFFTCLLEFVFVVCSLQLLLS